MPILLKTRVKRTAKTLIPARRARVGGLCGFRSPAERVHTKCQKTGRCADVRECPAELQHRSRSACGRLSAEEKPQAASRRKAWRFSAPARPLLPAVRAVLDGKNGAFLRG